MLNWLAAYPGDLYFNYLYAKTLVDEGKATQALPILEMVEAADPEFAPVYELHFKALVATGVKDINIVSAYSALTGNKLDNSIFLPGANYIYRVVKRSNQEKLEDAELLIQQAINIRAFKSVACHSPSKNCHTLCMILRQLKILPISITHVG